MKIISRKRYLIFPFYTVTLGSKKKPFKEIVEEKSNEKLV